MKVAKNLPLFVLNKNSLASAFIWNIFTDNNRGKLKVEQTYCI